MADNTISYKNRIFQILPDKYRISFAKAKVVVEKRLDESIHIKYKDQYLNFKEISLVKLKRLKLILYLLRIYVQVTFLLCIRGDIFSLY